jgi:hypothetical protein
MPHDLSYISIIVSIGFLVFLIMKIMEETIDNYEDKQHPHVLSLVSEIRHIDPRVNSIVDDLRFYEGKKSYTINKKHVYLCMKDHTKKVNSHHTTENTDVYDKNQLILVLIHEISHALCDEVGHTDKFHEIFDDLLEKASRKGVYDKSIPPISEYCPGPE